MLATALHTLDFPDLAADDGLVAVHGHQTVPRRLDEALVMRDAAQFAHVSHVYFRRFQDGRSSQPVAFVVDNSNGRLGEDQLAGLHKQLWLHGVAPLVYVVWPTRVDVLTCARKPDFWHQGAHVYRPIGWIDAAQLAGEVSAALAARKRFSAARLVDGTFWEDPDNADFACYNQAAHESLIQAIVEVDRDIEGERHPLRRRLLLLSVLIKYLEDRRVFAPTWFGRFQRGARSFFDVLQRGQPADVFRLLKVLERKFNGDVFTLPAGAERALTEQVLRHFAQLVEARTLGNQRYLWEQYSFEHIPVEVISHLYQRFVTGHGAVYTPPHLAALLLDHAMPYDQLRGDERVLDPACGSGVFLVGALRRLIQVWRSQNQWREPDVETLTAIAEGCIFGVELESMAVDLTVFSLSLALCDALSPEVIWSQLRFPKLRGDNVRESDFFDVAGALGAFDVIVGNPPFESELTEAGRAVDASAAHERGALPDRQAAYLFLEQSLTLLCERGRMCLVQPAGFLYNRKAARFLRRLVGAVSVRAILDFVSIRGLFDDADPKVVAVLTEAGAPGPEHAIVHLTFRRMYATKQRIGFELDHYDAHSVPQALAESDRLVWRANLLGGGRLVGLARRLRGMRSLGQFAEQQEWISGEGFILGQRTQDAPWLTGTRFLPTKALTDEGIEHARLGTVTERRFQRPRDKRLFEAPLVLIKENEALQAAFVAEGRLAYRDKIVGIHAPSGAIELSRFFQTFQSRRRLYQFSCALNGSQALVGKATAILKGDIEALPYPEDPRDLDLAFWETALQDDVLEHMAPYVRLGQNSDLMTRAAEPVELAAYQELFCQLLGSVYDNLTPAPPVFLSGLICLPFVFGETPEVDWLGPGSETHLRQLVYHDGLDSLRTVRVIRFYERNTMLLVKPDRLRYWIRSTAIRDADETLTDLYEQGY